MIQLRKWDPEKPLTKRMMNDPVNGNWEIVEVFANHENCHCDQCCKPEIISQLRAEWKLGMRKLLHIAPPDKRMRKEHS
jgi:hypothetical protein